MITLIDKKPKLKNQNHPSKAKATLKVISKLVLVAGGFFSLSSFHKDFSLYTPEVEIKIKSDATLSTTIITTGTSTDCIVERGSSGKWIYDLDYANRTNYIIKSIGAANWAIAANNFQATKEQPFRFATTWRWQDETCPQYTRRHSLNSVRLHPN